MVSILLEAALAPKVVAKAIILTPAGILTDSKATSINQAWFPFQYFHQNFILLT